MPLLHPPISRLWWPIYLLCLGLLSSQPIGRLPAQSGPPKPTPFQPIRYEEEYDSLADSVRTKGGRTLKYIPLGQAASGYLSIGGGVRQLYEYFRNANWAPTGPDGYWLQRYLLHADLHPGRHWRLFGQVGSGHEVGRRAGPRPIDEDRLFAHQAFADVWVAGRDSLELRLRVGRQEVLLGSGRLVTFREFPNLRLSHDGIRLLFSHGQKSLTAFAFRPVVNRTGVFDNPVLNRAQALWGLYGVWPFRNRSGPSLDAYYLGFTRQRAIYEQGISSERRHTVGGRIWGTKAGWQYDGEGVYQWGRFGPGEIQAWTASLSITYTLVANRLKPRFGLKGDLISGDRSRTSPSLQTFNALFPNPAYFSQSALFGPANLRDIHPSVQVELLPSLKAGIDWDFVWRASSEDGLYAPDGTLRRAGGGSRARYVGNPVQAEIKWVPNRHLTAVLIYNYINAGPFIRETQPAGQSVVFINTFVTYTF